MSWTVTWRAVSATQEREFANELEARAFAGVLESLAPELAIECEIAEAAADADALNVDGLRVYTDDALLDLETAADADVPAEDTAGTVRSLFDAWFAGDRAAAVGQDEDAKEHGSSSLVIVDLDAARAAKLDRLRGEGQTREEALVALLDAADD